MWLTLKLFVYNLQQDLQDSIISHNIISFKKNVSRNQEVRFTLSNEFTSNKLISNKLAIYYLSTQTQSFFTTQNKNEMPFTKLHK